MAKFENSKYNKIWDSNEGRLVVDAILADPELLKANHTFWQTKFRVDPQSTPTNAEGEAVFKSKMRQIETGTLMDMRAPLGDSIPFDKKGGASYTATIPDFIAKGFVETAAERWYKEKMFDQFADLKNIAVFATDVLQRGLDSANQTLSYMSAYLLSRGELSYLQGEGIQDDLYRPYIKEENFDTAGEKVWTDKTARLLDQMKAKEEKYRDLWGVNIPLQWEIERKQFAECFLPNEQVIEWVRYVNVINNTPLPETLVLNEDMVMAAITKFAGLSPIVLVEESQKDAVKGTVNGWKEGVAVLRPTGYAGLIRHTQAQDEAIYRQFANNAVTFNFTKAMGGLVTICNSVVPNGNLKEWHTDMWMSAVPSLDEFLYHVIIDTTQADA